MFLWVNHETAHTHARTHARKHAHKHTRTHTQVQTYFYSSPLLMMSLRYGWHTHTKYMTTTRLKDARLTCSQEENLVSAIHSIHLIHSYSSKAIVYTRAHHQRALVNGIHGVVHERMSTNEVDRFIWELFCGFKTWCECASRTLIWKTEGKSVRQMYMLLG